MSLPEFPDDDETTAVLQHFIEEHGPPTKWGVDVDEGGVITCRYVFADGSTVEVVSGEDSPEETP